MNELKACPFCRNGRINIVTDNPEYSLGLTDTAKFRVLCPMSIPGCGASSGWYDSVEDAITAWNRRVDTSDGLEPAIRFFED